MTSHPGFVTRAAPALLIAAIAAVWAIAIAAWPELPERVPVHFNGRGRPDRWADKSAIAWFVIPVLATVLGVGAGLLLPRWMVAMARANSRWLNVPKKQQFRALPAAARERAIRAPLPWLVALVIGLEALWGWLLYGSAEVAAGRWQALPPAMLYATVGGVLLAVAGLITSGVRAVRRAVARANR